MKYLISTFFALSSFSAMASSIPDCKGVLSLNSKDLWPITIQEQYRFEADYFLSVTGIALFTTTKGKPTEKKEYDFCEVLVLNPKKVEMVCEPSDIKGSPRFPDSLRIIETIETTQPGNFKVFAKSGTLPEALLDGSIQCGEIRP